MNWKFVAGLLLGFGIGFGCRAFGVPVPAPPVLVGALLVEGLNQQREVAVSPGKSVEVAGYEFRLDGVAHSQGPNYEADRGTVTVLRNDRVVTVLHPEKRAYASGGQVTLSAPQGALLLDGLVTLASRLWLERGLRPS